MKTKKVIVLIVSAIMLLSNVSSVFAGEIFDIAGGTWQGKKNNLNFSYPYKGDIYFGGNQGCLYGTYSHVALARDTTSMQSPYNYSETIYGNILANELGYGWSGMTIESTPTTQTNDVISRDVHRFWYYDRAAEGYVNNANSTTKNNAVNKAVTYSGSYDWNSSYLGTNATWQCGKLVSRAYYDVTGGGTMLGFTSFANLIEPDDIYYDSRVTIYTTSIAVSKPSLSTHALERLQMWKEKGVDTCDILFESGINKKGIDMYFNKLIQKGLKEEDIKSKYDINDDQYNQIINNISKDII